MRRRFIPFVVVLLTLIAANVDAQCVKIKDGAITDIKGVTLTLGFDQWGYNYQAHMFNGLTANYLRPTTVVSDGPESLVMKWSDNWLANVDCNNDFKLDRGLDPKTSLSTGYSLGWVTNHFEGDYLDGGESYHYTYFAKIVYDGGAACSEGSDSCLWDSYTIIEEVNNDPHGGFHGNDRSKLQNPAGLGFYTN